MYSCKSLKSKLWHAHLYVLTLLCVRLRNSASRRRVMVKFMFVCELHDSWLLHNNVQKMTMSEVMGWDDYQGPMIVLISRHGPMTVENWVIVTTSPQSVNMAGKMKKTVFKSAAMTDSWAWVLRITLLCCQAWHTFFTLISISSAIHKSQQCVYKHVIFVTTSFLASLLKSTDQIKKLLLPFCLLYCCRSIVTVDLNILSELSVSCLRVMPAPATCPCLWPKPITGLLSAS